MPYNATEASGNQEVGYCSFTSQTIQVTNLFFFLNDFK